MNQVQAQISATSPKSSPCNKARSSPKSMLGQAQMQGPTPRLAHMVKRRPVSSEATQPDGPVEPKLVRPNPGTTASFFYKSRLNFQEPRTAFGEGKIVGKHSFLSVSSEFSFSSS
ncbi:unnamed protein product [Linum trigynum]|uniref:Uncharacterized protein n=1 Tax=Linum trigynum TaxID=586398 RepID=A0AAV2CLV5_9ROSI